MLRGERRVITVSRVHERIAGYSDVPLSLPAVVGAQGATEVVWPEMDAQEERSLAASAGVIHRALKEIAA